MAEDSTEALARSQLETLYRLGILERSSDDVEQDQPRQNEDRGLNRRHEAFLAALPPPAAIHSMHTRPLPFFAEDSNSSRDPSEGRSGEYYSDSNDGGVLSNSGSHQHGYIPRRSRSLRSSRSSMPSCVSVANRDNRALRMWFRQWRSFVRGRREKNRRQRAADELLKQTVITKWACFLKRRRQEHERKRLLDSWKVARAISRWDQWKQRRRAVRGLLDGGRSSFMGKVTQKRVWRRWARFSERRMHVRDILTERICSINRQLIRAVWMELRTHAFRARKTRQALCRCLQGMRKLQVIQERQRIICVQYQIKVNLERKRVLLRRWRAFAHIRGRDKRLAWRVQFDVSRRRYFLLWCEAACISSRIARLREKITYRALCQHLSAWRTVTQAILLGDRVRATREKDIRKVYFQAFKIQAKFSAHCKRVQVVVTHRRLSRVVAYLHAWTTKRKHRNEGIRQLQYKWQTRLLRCSWIEGWLPLHHKRRAIKHACFTLEVRHLNAWKRFHRAQQEYYHYEERAEALYSKFCCQRSLTSWKIYCKMRLAHRQQLANAQEYYQKRLLQRGVAIMWSAVYQNAQNSLRGHHLRQQLRISTKKRHFCAWQTLAQSKRQMAGRVQILVQSSAYQNSICNPSRRTWDRWTTFVSLCKQRQRCDQHFRLRLKRQVLLGWHQQAKLQARCHVFSLRKSTKVVEIVFACWKSRVEKWRKVCVIYELAQRVYERKLCTRVMRDWRCWSSSYHRVRLCGESIQRRRETKLQSNAFLGWHERYHTQQCFAKLRRGRQQRQMRVCFNSWHSHVAQRKAFARKLVHFKQVYGVYPTASIVSRTWCRWKYAASQSRRARVLHRKYLLGQARRCWSHWKVFHAACRALRVWRRVAGSMSSSNNKLGKRIRCLRESRHRALQRCALGEWKAMVQRRRNLQDRQSLYKHQLNRELEGAHWKSQQAARLHLNSWFRRWCTAQNKSSNLAKDHYHTGLCQMVLRSWWKTTIHSKQERVLAEAQRAIGKLSYYHPQQQTYVAQVRRIENKTRERKLPKRKPKVVAPKNTTNMRAESMKNMRRMLDPTESQSYSKLHQEGSRDFSSAEQSSRGIDALQHTNSASTHPVPASKPHSRKNSAHTAHVKSSMLKTDVCGLNNENPMIIMTGRNFAPRTINESLRQQSVTWSNQEQSQPIHPDGTRLHVEMHNEDRLAAFELETNCQSKAAEKELPLFDDEELKFDAPKSRIRYADLDAPEESVGLPSDHRHEQTVNKDHSDGRRNGWVYPATSSLEPPQHTTSGDIKRGVCGAAERVPTMFEPSQSLAPSIASTCSHENRYDKLRVVRTRSAAHKTQIKVVHSTKTDVRPLADILALSSSNDTKLLAADADIHRKSETEWDSSAIQEIVGFYVDSIVANADANSSDGDRVKKKRTRLQTCFRMVRDLALFQNDFYIDEMRKIYDTNFKGEFIDLPRYVSGADKREEQARLALFLEHIIENHPAYRKYVDLAPRRNSRSPLPLCALSWLAQYHLRPNVLLQKRARIRPRKSNEYWIWEQIPSDMDVALEKLLPVVTKYMRVLGQFFLRQAVQGSSSAGKPQDYRMSSTAFINLMKQVRVFPQLFHRRELENAVKQSSCSSPESEELNFPEFIEALVRCSCNLRWGELDGSNPAANTNDTVVVIKFVMLIFAMEGQGTVLKKRNEDVGAILGFLGEQQKKKQAEKMFRFRKMLSDDRRRERASRKYQVPSVWNQVRLHFSTRTSPTRSTTKSHDTFDELTESWDGGSPRRISTEPFVFDAQTDQPFGLDVSPTSSVQSRNEKHVHLSPAEYTTEVRDPHTLNSDIIDKGVSNPPSPSGEVPSTYAGQAIDSSGDAESSAKVSSTQLELTPANPAEDVRKANSCFTNPISSTNSVRDTIEVVSRHEGGHTITRMQPSGLVEPMEKDEFLREILNSIGDVEVMLNQPRFAGSNYSKNGKHHQQRVPTNTAISAQRRAEVGSVNSVPSLNDLAAETLVYSCNDWQTPGNSAGMDSEVQIRDPMLNYLTDVQRFTEITDRTSLVAIAHLSGIPFEDLPSQTINDFSSDSWTPQEHHPTEEVRGSTASQTPADESY